jgi:hypothetical protein
MDPNHWPALVWLLIALVLGSFVACFFLLIWGAVFRRHQPTWLLDAALLACSGLILVVVLMVFVESSAGRLDKASQKLIGEPVLAAAGLLLVWVSGRIFNRKKRAKLGATHGEFSVPHDFK